MKVKLIALIISVLIPSANANQYQIEVVNTPVLDVSDNYDHKRYSDNQLIEECNKWRLNKEDINKIFKISNRHEYNPYREFSQTPCDIRGKAKINNEIWDFYINGGGITTFTNNDKVIYLGCESEECEPFFIIPYDGMNP